MSRCLGYVKCGFIAVLLMLARVNAQTITAQYINGVPQADHFTGSDMCSKIRAAAEYALANGINQVDATHFSGTQTCATNMLQDLCSPGLSTCNLVVNLGAVHIESSVPQSITNSGMKLNGMSPAQTQLEYTGSATPAIFAISDIANGITDTQLENICIYGDVSNATDALLIQRVHHSQFINVWTWGVTGCGIHTEFAVTDSWLAPRTSQWDADTIGIYNGDHTTPASGLCFDESSLGQTTDGTVIDAAAEGLTGIGWTLIGARGMTFTSGTSEGNLQGLTIASASTNNTFINSDLEGNSSGNDVLDQGTRDTFMNIIATSGPENAVEIGSSAVLSSVWGGDITSVQYDPGSTQYNTVCKDYNCKFAQGILSEGYFNTTEGYQFNGSSGYTGTVAPSGSGCTITVKGGIITGKSGNC